MTFTTKSFAAAATLIALSGPAFADGHAVAFDPMDANAVAEARLDLELDTDGNGEVTNDEIIEGYMDVFDTNGNGMIDADERGEAEIMLGE